MNTAPKGEQENMIAMNVLEEELSEGVEYCVREGIGMEITAFAFPGNLDQRFQARLDRHVAATRAVTPLLVHGPFLDLYCTSPDPRIVAVARKRHDQALTAAESLGATVYVAHLNSIPLIRNEEYRERFVERASEFWKPLADRAGRTDMTIVLENMWEPDPGLQRRVVDAAGHAYLRTSFDNGHALVFSDLSSADWVQTLGDTLVHMHVHDNDGTYDQHLPVGEGTEDWAALLGAWEGHAPEALLVVESDRLELNRRSLRKLKGLMDRS